MTAVVTFVLFFLMIAHYLTLGPFVAEGWTIYMAAFKVATLSAATFCFLRFIRKQDWCTFRAGCAIIAYAILAPKVYNYEQAILLSALLDLSMACYFALFGRKRWELLTGAVFIMMVAVSTMTYLGLIPSHLDRPWPQFLAFSQGDITAILGYCFLIIIGFGAGDGGARIRDWFARVSLVVDYRRRLVHRLGALAKVEKA